MSAATSKFNLKKSGLELERRAQAGTFFDVLGRKSAIAGYENRSLEAWVYPLKVLDDFKLSFRLQGYPLDIQGAEIMTSISTRPEATILTYTHAAFTVRQIIFAPLEEPGVVMLLDVESVLPLSVTASFRPRLRLMWPAGLMTGNLGWDEATHRYSISEETHRFVGIIGSPGARDIALMPYQEEPRDVPVQFVVDVTSETMKSHFVPIIIAGSVEGREKANETYDKLLANVSELYEKNVAYYERMQNETVQVETPDERLNTAFKWAKIGVDKGVATNPFLGTGLLAGFRTSGESERPGFAWFFGRDALWTSLALNSYGDFATTRIALEFLKKFQREDGKIPHEISQSASLLPWFTDYPYAWASADATPLYVIAHADYWRTSGDLDFLKANWDSILKAYRFTAATDTDNNGLVENTTFGHGWVEGGALYPPHEEIYMQALWVEASRNIAELALLMNNKKLADEALATAERTRAAIEKIYWSDERGHYAFSTSQPREEPVVADSGPNRERRTARMNELGKGRLIDEDTVMPAVPLWWRVLDDEHAQSEIDHLGGGAIVTDWGARIISNQSQLYDPLSYHNGSVWPLFTGWMAVGAYRYGRPHVGYQALRANASLTFTGALGYVTELLSGDFNTPFGRSSHHQIWSEAMVITPMLRGLLGIEVMEGGGMLRFAPQLPADWNSITVRNVRAGTAVFDLMLKRTEGRETITTTTRRELEKRLNEAPNRSTKLVLAPAFPLDARIRKVTVNGRNATFTVKILGDRQFVELAITNQLLSNEVVFTYDEGTDVSTEPEELRPGAGNQGLRILRSRARRDALHLSLEGLSGHSYSLKVFSPRLLIDPKCPSTKSTEKRQPQQLAINFEGPDGVYARRDLTIPLCKEK
jgi:glycogen debranching enzyme